MGDVYWGLHLPLAAAVRRSGITKAIETGSYFGAGALHLGALFENVWTIERNFELYDFCVEQYSELCANIAFVNGDSATELKRIATSVDGPFLYVLDAHWFPTDSLSDDGQLGQCPVIDELTQIAECGGCSNGSVVIIDDADMFLGSLPAPFRGREFPSIDELLIFLRTDLEAETVRVLDDVIVAGPSWLGESIEDYQRTARAVGGPASKRIGVR